MEAKLLGNIPIPIRTEIFRHYIQQKTKDDAKKERKAIDSYPNPDEKYIKPGTILPYDAENINILARKVMIPTRKRATKNK